MRTFIFGASGFAAELHEWMTHDGLDTDVEGFIVDDDHYDESHPTLLGKPVHRLSSINGPARYYLGVSDCTTKKKLVSNLSALDWKCATYVSTRSVVSEHAEIGEGVVICPYSTVSPFALVEDFVTMNCRSGIGHHSTVGRYATLLGNNCVNGNVSIGSETTLGTGAIIHPGRSVGAGCVVGLGAVVIRNVPEGSTVFGNPAKRI